MSTPLRRAALVLALAAAVGSAAGCSSGNAKPGATATPVASAARKAGSAFTSATRNPTAPTTPTTPATPTVPATGSSASAATPDAAVTTDAAAATDAASNTPEDVRHAYGRAYETKSFGAVIDSACAAYKSEYGTDTTLLAKNLQDYTITATDYGDPQVGGSAAYALLSLTGTSAAGPDIDITFTVNIVREDGQWRFCGDL